MSENTQFYQFILPLHTAQSISNIHFILNQNCNLRNKVNSGSKTWAKWLTNGALVYFCTVCVVRVFYSLWRCAWCLYYKFILFLCKSEVWTLITWQWKWNTTFKVFLSPRHIFLYICTKLCVPTPFQRGDQLFFLLNSIILTSHLQWNPSITALQIKDTSVIRTAIDSPKWSTIETCTYIVLYLKIKDTSLFRITDSWSRPKWSYCKLYTVVKATPPSAIASGSVAVPNGSSWRWLVYETKLPDRDITSVRLSLR